MRVHWSVIGCVRMLEVQSVGQLKHRGWDPKEMKECHMTRAQAFQVCENTNPYNEYF